MRPLKKLVFWIPESRIASVRLRVCVSTAIAASSRVGAPAYRQRMDTRCRQVGRGDNRLRRQRSGAVTIESERDVARGGPGKRGRGGLHGELNRHIRPDKSR